MADGEVPDNTTDPLAVARGCVIGILIIAALILAALAVALNV